MNRRNTDGVRETRVVHEVHRRATTLLAELLASPAVPSEAGEFRDFVVEMLEHHHTCEDHDLWPLIGARAPELQHSLRQLTAEHDDLQAGLDRLKVLSIGNGRPNVEAGGVAAAVCDLVHAHLAHEEPVLFSALDQHTSDDEWDGFSRRTVASAPQTGLPYLLALIYEVGPPADADLILRHVPQEARATVPARRAAGEEAIANLRSSVGSHSGAPR